MPKEKKMWDNVLTVIMSLLCLLWIYPIVLILLNSLKKEGTFTTSTVFKLPTAETFAGLQSVPGDLIEAAKIDGANDREILFKIKIPMVMPSVTICTFLTLTNSFKLFDQNVALTAGEPANASEMLALNIYNTFYGRSGAQWKGIGQAKAVVFFLVVVVISLIQLKFTRSKEVQQ